MTSFVIVLAAERLPVLESIELQHQLQHAGISVDALVVNKRSPENSGEFLEERRRQENVHLRTLSEALPDLPRQEISLMAQDVVGLEAVQRLGALLAA
jgi:arsenite-transporting ATPase